MTMEVAVATDSGRDDEEADAVQGDAPGLPQEDSVSWVGPLDTKRLNPTWHAVDPEAVYIPGNLLADRVADLVRGQLFPRLRNRDAHDCVEAHTDIDGNAYLWLCLGAVGFAEVLEAALIGFQLRPEPRD